MLWALYADGIDFGDMSTKFAKVGLLEYIPGLDTAFGANRATGNSAVLIGR